MESATFGHHSRVTQMLSTDQLERLLDRSRNAGAGVVGRLRPGLSDDQMDRLTAPLGLRLPSEARTWWGWHDGTDGGPDRLAADIELGPMLEFLTLSEAVDLYRMKREVGAEVRPEEPDWYWHRTWLPITRYGKIACECEVPEDAASPILGLDHEINGDFDRPIAESWGQMVSWWIDEFERGAWYFDSERRRWLVDQGLESPDSGRRLLV